MAWLWKGGHCPHFKLVGGGVRAPGAPLPAFATYDIVLWTQKQVALFVQSGAQICSIIFV
jgi:hypothetical protein